MLCSYTRGALVAQLHMGLPYRAAAGHVSTLKQSAARLGSCACGWIA